MERGVVKRQVVDGRPEIEDVAVRAAVGVKTLENVFAQVGREGARASRRLAVNRTGSATLVARAAQIVEESQMFEHLLHGHLLTQKSEIDLGACRWRWERRVDS
jgi:hypothetical protein